jgi:hypothetical protein
MAVNTTGIRTNTNCAIPNQLTVAPSDTGVSTLSATSVDGCSLTATFTPSNAAQQYGVVNVPNCVVNTTNPAFQPVRPFPVSGRCMEMFIPFRFSSGSGNKTQPVLPLFFANRVYNFSM